MTAKTSKSELFGNDHLHHIEASTVTDSRRTSDGSGSSTLTETDSDRQAPNVQAGSLPGWVEEGNAYRGAIVSRDRAHRYALWRKDDLRGPIATFLMLNPSTADASADDPTIRKCCGFARRWGYSGIWVVNLFAFRATDPRELARHPYETIVGPDNDGWLAPGLEDGAVFAWGCPSSAAVRKLVARRVPEVLRMAAGDWECIGVSADGSPRHPLMLPYATPRVRWEPPPRTPSEAA